MKIHHIAITVKNLRESQKFYQEFFNFKFDKSFERKDMGGKAVFLELEGFFLELWEFDNIKYNVDDLSNIKIPGIRHIAFAVEDINEIIQNFRNKGIEITNPKLGASGHMYSFTQDPNGVAIEIYQS